MRRLRPAALAASAALVLQLLVLPAPAFASEVSAVVTDKVVHMAAFGMLAVLLWILAGGRATLLVFAAVMGIGLVDELRQAVIPGREADFADLAADAAGAGLALLFLHLFPSPAPTPQGAPTCAES
jgi:hypothetical protein